MTSETLEMKESVFGEWNDKNKGVITIICTPGQWFQFPRKFLKYMTANEALMLAELLNEATLKRSGMSQDGWFKYSIKDFEERMYLSEDTQRRILRNLEAFGIVERGICKDTRVRLFRVYYDRILEILNEDVDDCTPCENAGYTVVQPAKSPAPTLRKRKVPPGENTGSTIIGRRKENKKNTLSPPAASRRFGDGATSSEGFFSQGDNSTLSKKDGCQIAAEKLYNRLLEKGLVDKRKSNVKKWAETIRKFLNTNDQIPRLEFKEVLLWYLKAMGGEFVPVVYSAEGFCSKYFQIKAAMIREGESPITKKVSDMDNVIERLTGKYQEQINEDET